MKKWNKKFFILGVWYFVGLSIASMFNNKKWKDLTKEMDTCEVPEGECKLCKWKLKILMHNILEIHENLFEKVRKEVMTEENKEYFNRKKLELQDSLEDYKDEGMKILADLQVKGKDYSEVAKEKLEELFEERKEDFETFKKDAPKKFNEIKDKLLDEYNNLRKKKK